MGATKLILLTASVLGADDVTMIQFTADWCKHCQAVAPTIDRLERDNFPIVRINADTHKELIGKHRVRALPTFIVMRDGREVSRAEGELGFDRLVQMFEAAGHRPPRPTVRGQSPARNEKGFLSRALEQFTQEPSPNPRTLAAVESPARPALTSPAITTSAEATRRAPDPTITAADSMPPEERAMRASVKLKVTDPKGYSSGSGTIIDTHGEDALVLTCGHIFRDSNGQGAVEVELQTESGRKTVKGHILAWEPDYHDIGLIAIRPGAKVVKAEVASSVTFRPHDTVFNIGCSRGADPTMQRGRISALNRFVGAPNIEVTGEPVIGRSGGGLFDRNGALIGVCKFADPTDHEGVYSSIESIHLYLNKVGLKHVYQPQPATNQLVAAAAPQAAPQAAPKNQLDVRPALASVTPVGNVRPASATRTVSVGADSEVIVIVRSKSNPRAPSQVTVVDDASDELLQAIHAAVNRHRKPATTEAIQTAARTKR